MVRATSLRILAILLASSLILFGGTDSAFCEFSEGNMHVQYGLQQGVIQFRVILTGILPTYSTWNAIGFGRSMWSGIDVIMIRIINGRATISDEYVQGFQAPYADSSNDVIVDQISYADGMVILSFHRAAFNGDTRYDAQISGCQSWKFAAGSNPLSPRGEVYHHRRTPTGRTVCIEQCRI